MQVEALADRPAGKSGYTLGQIQEMLQSATHWELGVQLGVSKSTISDWMRQLRGDHPARAVSLASRSALAERARQDAVRDSDDLEPSRFRLAVPRPSLLDLLRCDFPRGASAALLGSRLGVVASEAEAGLLELERAGHVERVENRWRAR